MGDQQRTPKEAQKLPKPALKLNGEPKKQVGQKTKLTPKFFRDVERLAAKGLNQKQIATILNVSDSRLSIWKNEKGELAQQYVAALERGQAKGVKRRLEKIEKSGEKSWQALAWQLERIHPEQFGRRDNLRIGNPDGTPLETAPTVIAPTVVFVQPEKQQLGPVIDVEANGHSGHLNGNGHGLPEGNGK